MGPTDASIRDHGDASGRADGRGGDRSGDHTHPSIDRRTQGRDGREHEGRDEEAIRREEDGIDEAGRTQDHQQEVAEARRRWEEGRDGPQAQDGPRPAEEGGDHSQADDGSEDHHAEVAEARRRGEEGRDFAEAQDGPRPAEDRFPKGSIAGSGRRSAGGERRGGNSAHRARVGAAFDSLAA